MYKFFSQSDNAAEPPNGSSPYASGSIDRRAASAAHDRYDQLQYCEIVQVRPVPEISNCVELAMLR